MGIDYLEPILMLMVFFLAVVIIAFGLTDIESLQYVKRGAKMHAYDPMVFLLGTKRDLLVCFGRL